MAHTLLVLGCVIFHSLVSVIAKPSETPATAKGRPSLPAVAVSPTSPTRPSTPTRPAFPTTKRTTTAATTTTTRRTTTTPTTTRRPTTHFYPTIPPAATTTHQTPVKENWFEKLSHGEQLAIEIGCSVAGGIILIVVIVCICRKCDCCD